MLQTNKQNKMIQISAKVKRASLVCSLFALPSLAQAEQIDSISRNVDLAELTVTATKTQILKHEIPSSVSILGKRLLEQTQFQSIKDLGAYVPNVYIPDFGSSLSTPIFIRGIGSRRINMVGLYSDGIPLLEGASIDTDYTDLRTIEILRGPQGSLYGRGAMGGIINMRSYRPLDSQFTQLNILGGQYGLYGINGQSYQKVSSRLGLAANINYLHKGGYHMNEYGGSKVDGLNNISAKFALQYQYNGWDIYTFAQYQYRNQGGYPYAIVDKNNVLGAVNYDTPSHYKRKLFTAGLSIEKKLPNNLKFKSATGYQHLDDEMLMDQDFTPSPTIVALQQSRKNVWTEELSLSRTSDRYSWIAGVYGYAIGSNKNVENSISMLPNRNSQVSISYGEPGYGVAFYHQSSYKITSRLTAELGLRYDWEHREQDYRNVSNDKLTNKTTIVATPASAIDRQFTPKVALNYRIGDEHRIYASVLRGYQSGGFNVQFEAPEEQSYKPEYSWNYELGTHLYYLNGKLQVDAAAFYIDWEQQQVQQAMQSLLGSKITNAGRSRSIGAELSVAFRPSRDLNLSASYGYTKATFIRYDEFVSPKTNISRANNYIPQVPKQTFAGSIDYTIKSGLRWIEDIRFGLQYRGLGDIYWDSANTKKQGFYSLLDGQIGLTHRVFTFEVWGRNLLNSEYRSYQITTQGRNIAQRGAPRHFGATIRIKL